MGHELLIYGMIEGASYRQGTNEYRLLQDRNADRIGRLLAPEQDSWPWLNRSMFALPGPWPHGTYRRQVIHFGVSIKDDPDGRTVLGLWMSKLEGVLRDLYWHSTRVIVESDFEDDKLVEWAPTREAVARMLTDDPSPVRDWQRREVWLPSWRG
jgi:hypothetical protein